MVSSAYSVEFEVPTSATVPGTVTVTGDFSMSKLPLGPPKNDPQCLTVDVVSGLATPQAMSGWTSPLAAAPDAAAPDAAGPTTPSSRP